MYKVIWAALFVLAIVALVAVPGCQGERHADDGCGAGCACSAAGDGGADACGCQGCSGCACHACGCAGCGDGCGCGCGAGDGAISAKDAKRARAIFKSYRGWHRANAKPFLSKPHGRHMIHDYVNGVARGTFDSGKGTYRTGAVVVKEGWKRGKRNMVWIMEKRNRGYDAKRGDWWYAELNAKGQVRKAGKVTSCIDCHDDDRANDWIFGLK